MWWDTIAVQNSIFEWCRDHRVHHKFTETHADPRNAKRGFFFAHMGWLMVRKHPDVIRKGATVDMSDLAKDPVVMFQHRHYSALVTIFAFGIPTVIPYFFGPGETLWVCWLSTCFRYVLSLHLTWLVNSAAHLWGPRPYDKGLNPSENMAVSILTGGEGWHNFHHVYPQDYKASELGLYAFSPATAFIDLFATLGLAYDLKTIPKRVIELRMQRTGDGSQYRH
ncbi:stearoyl-CoA desaturase 5 [Folsomia candida]|uniref:stearoyl-CoA desaturase 5 n=1 Tax=Folsomia candida TaxID=158441 RepID=UPI0016052C75|nr:stearoyl-CoA desaturase 5 [Folsomia candida]